MNKGNIQPALCELLSEGIMTKMPTIRPFRICGYYFATILKVSNDSVKPKWFLQKKAGGG
jgi:hypothetical protein